MKKQLLNFILSLIMLVYVLKPISIQAAIEDLAETEDMTMTEDTEIITGEAGENVIYTYNKDTKTMIFSGSGMLSWAPERDYSDVTKVVIEEGITHLELSLGGHFYGLQELTIPKSVEKINVANAKVLGSNYNLRKIYNYSSVEFDPRSQLQTGWGKKSDAIRNGKRPDGTKAEYYSPLAWIVNEEEVTKIPPHSEAIAVPKEYKIMYDLNGGEKDKGSWITSYCYGTTQDLPKPKRDGYFFAGWKTDGKIYFPTRAFSKIGPTQYSDVELKAIWRKIKIVKNKNASGFKVLVSPKKYPQLTMIVSKKKDITQELKKGMDSACYKYSLAGKGTKSKTNDGMRVFNIKKFGSKQFNWKNAEEFEKGRTYYIWIKYGSVQDFEYWDAKPDENIVYINKDAYYFYKTKITF